MCLKIITNVNKKIIKNTYKTFSLSFFSINFFLFNFATCLRCKICLGKLEIISFCNFDGVSLDDAFKLLVLDKQPSGTK
jgi:hypothetical protein